MVCKGRLMVCQGTDHVGGGSQVIMVCKGRLMETVGVR